jgi:hypothetical protein
LGAIFAEQKMRPKRGFEKPSASVNSLWEEAL